MLCIFLDMEKHPCVDLKLSPTDNLDIVADSAQNGFGGITNSLHLSIERPVQDSSLVLDIYLYFSPLEHLHCAYEPESKKPLLPYDSSHSKVTKGGIATTS